MKKLIKPLSVLLLILMLASPVLAAEAAHPTGFWPLFDAYSAAVEAGNTDAILKAGDAILALYAKHPMNNDIAAMSYNIYYWRFTNTVFEIKGNYAAAIDNAERLSYFAKLLGFTDAAIAAEAKIRKLDPMTEVYALSDDTGAAPYFGAKYEPVSGTYYGRVANVSGSHSAGNTAELATESIVSFYYVVGDPISGDSTAVIDHYKNGSHVVHIALNFPIGENVSSQVKSGIYDGETLKLLDYIAALQCPVLIRIGAEMNLWEQDTAAFQAAYRHLAELIREHAPNAALVWSPNYVGYWGSEIADYYPGDAYVDWVGVSLYMNNTTADGQTPYGTDSTYFGRGAFSDCVLSLRETADFAAAHGKPVIISEGGTGIINKTTGTDYSAHAAAQVTKMYSALSMVYPNVKAIIYFDADPSVDNYKFAMANSSAVKSAYAEAAAQNPGLIPKAGGTAPAYVKLGGCTDKDGLVDIAAYGDTVYSDKMTVTYYLSGQAVNSVEALPFRFTLDTTALTAGKYQFTAVFNDGAGFTETLTYTLTKLSGGSVVFSEGYDAAPMDAPSGWAAAEVGEAIAAGLVPDALQVRYTTNITRADFCRLIIRLMTQKTGQPIDEYLKQKGLSPDDGHFADTSDKDILAACALGIVNGRGNGLFDPHAGISREEAAKMLMKTAEILSVKATGTSPVFLDADSFSSWAADAIAFVTAAVDQASGKPVMGGVGGGLFDAKGPYTCQQAYITVLRLYRAG